VNSGGRKSPAEVTSWLVHVTRVCRPTQASIVYAGAWNVVGSVVLPKPKTWLIGRPDGRICWANCRAPIE
jgi:hypothetical protein